MFQVGLKPLSSPQSSECPDPCVQPHTQLLKCPQLYSVENTFNAERMTLLYGKNKFHDSLYTVRASCVCVIVGNISFVNPQNSVEKILY